MTRAASPFAWTVALFLAAGFLYFHRLGSTPAYLSIEEVSQAREAAVFATTGRTAQPREAARDSPEGVDRVTADPVWIYLAPLWVYVAAALLKILPFSEALVRQPSAAAGVLNVVLMFFVGREMFGRMRGAVIAACLLMLTPSHFLQSRIGTGQIGTVTFVLAWLLFLLRYINHQRPRDLFVAAFCLGLGMYAYAGGLVIMPVYFLVTLVVVTRHRAAFGSPTALTAASTGFGLAFVPLALWHLFHPTHLVGLATYYTHGEYNKNLGWKGFVGANAISHFDAWWDCYNPDKLFFSGDPDLRFSTRSAGYFLLPASALMAVGLWSARHMLRVEVLFVLGSGLLLGPLPAALVSSSELKRWLTFVPFAIVVATSGAERMFADRRRAVRLAAAVLLVLCVFQAQRFVDDYFGRYRVGSAVKFGGNLRGAIQETLAVSTSRDCVLLDSTVSYLSDQWDLYTRAYGRTDLAMRTSWFGPDGGGQPPPSCPATTVLASAGDMRFTDWRSTPIPELNGSVLYTVYRRDAP